MYRPRCYLQITVRTMSPISPSHGLAANTSHDCYTDSPFVGVRVQVRLVQNSRGVLLIFNQVCSEALCDLIGPVQERQHLGDQRQKVQVWGRVIFETAYQPGSLALNCDKKLRNEEGGKSRRRMKECQSVSLRYALPSRYARYATFSTLIGYRVLAKPFCSGVAPDRPPAHRAVTTCNSSNRRFLLFPSAQPRHQR